MPAELRAGALYMVVVFAVGALFGPVRELVLAPMLGPGAAIAIEAVPLLLAMAWAAPWAARRFAVPPTPRARLLMGLGAVLLLVLAETALDALLRGRGPGMWLERALTGHGRIGLALMAAFAVMPLLLRRRA
jgi:hypothetical protein